MALDGNTFHGHHELKFGFGWRKASVDSSDVYPGNGLITYFNGYPDMIAKITPAKSPSDRRGLLERISGRYLDQGSA